MPGWSIDLAKVEHLRKDAVTLGIGWITMRDSQEGGSSPTGNTLHTNSSSELTTG